MRSAPRRPVVVITGAASGIGRAIARHLADNSWAIACLDRSPSDWEHAYQVDVSDADEVGRAVAAVAQDLGEIDAVIAAAGHYEIVPIADISAEQWHQMLHVHLGGILNLARAVVPSMVARGFGTVVAITSELAIGGGDRDSHYAAAKGAVIGFLRSLAAELAPHGVRVNGIAPGPTDTPLLTADSECRTPEYLGALPLRRIVRPEEIALVAAHLLEHATFTTGEVISPNAGAVI
jgi:NAD(P)-dependent dehydrogenase (short-subunit alcohol dehydrogenase family)